VAGKPTCAVAVACTLPPWLEKQIIKYSCIALGCSTGAKVSKTSPLSSLLLCRYLSKSTTAKHSALMPAPNSCRSKRAQRSFKQLRCPELLCDQFGVQLTTFADGCERIRSTACVYRFSNST